MKPKRIVISGIGLISPLGIGKEQYWQSLLEARSGIKPITLFDTSNFKVKVGGQIPGFKPQDILGKRTIIDLDRSTRLLLSATKFAQEDAHLDRLNSESVNTGVVVGTAFGNVQSVSEFDWQSLEEGPGFTNPSRFPNTGFNAAASKNAIQYKIKGLNATISTGFCACLDALDYAVFSIHCNRAERIILGTTEGLCIQTFTAFHKLGCLSGSTNGGVSLSCPFDKKRSGIILSEASVVFILEKQSLAQAEGSQIYAQIQGIGSGFNVHNRIEGMSQAMREALDDAHLEPKDIDCIFANANSSYEADFMETEAIKAVFGEFAYKIPTPAIKSMIGEALGASGGLALAAAIGSIQKDFIPPTINYQEKDAQCDLDYVPNFARRKKVNIVMINAFDPKGINASLIIARKR